MKVTSLDGRQLRKMLRKEAAARCVVLDCRPYLAFAASSVRGSLNVNLNSVVLRRARGGAVSARYVLPDEAARARLLQEGGGGVAAVVVLDQGSRHWQKLREESAARVVLTSLLACLPAGPRVYFLKGTGSDLLTRDTSLEEAEGLWGYETFHSEYPECCVDVKPISQEKVETERALISQCGKSALNINYRPAYDQGGPVEILPFLYLGSAYHASKCEFLANLHITALLNVSRRTSEACTTHLHYKWIPVEDSHAADISSHFQEAIDFIDCVREKGGKVLVHCEAGISRSPTICMAYLMKTKQFHLKDAFDYIKQRRSVVSPNFGFMGQLLQYESEILPSTPTPQAPSCQGEAAGPSFIAHLQTLSPDVQGSYCTFPTSVLAPVPTHSTVSELSRSPMATATSC
ncbi:dual specificity protein phosphatase 5 isoform X1 [Hippopotamus amphibius kiboko]|uniref:dual specificity protein phosphatase 5 isoform X1 n=1 Tax=Hippopotamus amphibius kiboko TaxID=575201 RepID=UPI002593A916|nr:dual specificity protein phosphatase 5 isoform X1 [Hippopotamus amphibius kiboko]